MGKQQWLYVHSSLSHSDSSMPCSRPFPSSCQLLHPCVNQQQCLPHLPNDLGESGRARAGKGVRAPSWEERRGQQQRSVSNCI